MSVDLTGFTPETSSVAVIATVSTPNGSAVQVVTVRAVDLLTAAEAMPSAWWPTRVIEHQRLEDEAREVARLAASTIAAACMASPTPMSLVDWPAFVREARKLLAEARRQVMEAQTKG